MCMCVMIINERGSLKQQVQMLKLEKD